MKPNTQYQLKSLPMNSINVVLTSPRVVATITAALKINMEYMVYDRYIKVITIMPSPIFTDHVKLYPNARSCRVTMYATKVNWPQIIYE
jgi:hypothetical protein